MQGAGRHGVGRPDPAQRPPPGLERLGDLVVPGPAVGAEVLGDVHVGGPDLRGHVQDHTGGVARPTHEVATDGLVEGRQTGVEEDHPGRARGPAQAIIVHEEGDQLVGPRGSGHQRGVVGQAQVPAEPDDGGAGALSHPAQSSRRSAETKASGGTSTRPMLFIRFLPSFWRSISLRLRVMSPP